MPESTVKPRAWLALLMALAAPCAAAAQNVAGHVFDARDTTPLRGVFVIALDSSEAEIARVLTTEVGAFQLPARAEQLRVERVGFETVDTSIAGLPGLQRASITLNMRPHSPTYFDFSLADSACVVNATTRPATRHLWIEGQKALSAVSWTESSGLYLYEASEFDRLLDTNMRILSEATESIRNVNVHPLTIRPTPSPFPPPSSVLDDAFRENSCFSVARRDSSTVMLIAHASGEMSISTTALWFEARSGALTRVEFQHMGQDSLSVAERIDYARLDDGAWIASSWHTQLPVLQDTAETEHVGYRQVGGSVTSVTRGGTSVFADQRVTLVSGTIYDSTAGNVLPNALVALAGTEHWATTDAEGAFFMAGPFDGRYDLVFGHPRLDSIGFISPPETINLELGDTRDITLVVPRLETILTRRCPTTTITPLRRALFGIVRDADGAPIPGADVAAFWHTIPRSLQGFAVDDHEAQGTTDEFGTFTLCGIAVSREVVVRARYGDQLSEFVPVQFEGTGVTIGETRGVGDRQIARLDLTLLPDGNRAASIQGTVSDEATLEPVAGAQVEVVGTPYSVVTDSTGYFTVGNLPPGVHRITARRVGYRRVRHELNVAPGETVLLSDGALRMPSGVTELAPIVVEAEGVALSQRHLVATGFFDRRDAGLGNFATREDIERWSPIETTDVLRHIPGARIVPNPRYGINGDTRRYLVQTSRSRCAAAIYLDGMYLGTTAENTSLDFDTMLSVENIEGIEAYSSPAQIPARFNRTGSTCGAIVFWTR